MLPLLPCHRCPAQWLQLGSRPSYNHPTRHSDPPAHGESKQQTGHRKSRCKKGLKTAVAAETAAATATAVPSDLEHSLEEAALVPIIQDGVPEDQVVVFPATQGVYAVYDKDEKCQFIGISRQIATSIGRHYREQQAQTHAIRFARLEDAPKEQLSAVWQSWLEQTVAATGEVPAGNQKGNTSWLGRRPKGELRLTPGKGLGDLTCSLEDLLTEVVKRNKVVAFIKGTRTQPQCGFSYKVLSILGESKADFEVVNVLDETYNPGLRETIKTFSQWPTIPQLYIKGEFVGGADIVEELNTSGELKQLLSS